MEKNEENLEENLIQYDKNPTTTIPQILETYLEQIAKTGYTKYPWHRIKTLFKVKLENVIADFSSVSPVENVPAMPNVEEFKYEEMKTRIFEQLESYSGVPFTIQRICELITQPYDYYKRIDKFMRGLERVMLVVTTIDPNPLPAGALAPISNGFSADLTINMVQESLGTRLDEAGSSRFLGKSSFEEDSGVRRPGDSLESPAKRIRLSAEEDGGPCDSADQVPPPMQNGSPPGNECVASASLVSSPGGGTSADNAAAAAQTSPSTSAAASVPSTSAASSPSTSAAAAAVSPSTSAAAVSPSTSAAVSPSTSAAATSLPSTSAGAAAVSVPNGDQAADSSPTDDNMEIDIECTSSYRMESNPESSPKQDNREAVPETKDRSGATAVEAAPTANGGSKAADNLADETDGSGSSQSATGAAMDTEECAAEEGISTSGERGSGEAAKSAAAQPRGAEEGISTSGESGRAELSAPQQVETNSEAEASGGDAETFSGSEKAEELPSEERMASEAQEIVVSSEATVEPRVEELAGAADSSDQVAAARQQPCEVEGAPDQSQCPAESIQPNQQAGEAIEDSAEAASVSPAEEAVSQASNTVAAETSATSQGAIAEAVTAAPSTEAVSVTAASGDGETQAAATVEESGNEAVEVGASAAEEKTDSPDQSL